MTERWELAEAPEGYHYEAVEEADHWRVSDEVRKCRYAVNRKGCGKPTVAALNRGRYSGRRLWWHYCGEHLFGRWIEDGRIMRWRLVPNDAAGHQSGGTRK